MATIIQVNRINTNRAGAVTDTVAALQSGTALSGGDINAVHLPLGEGLAVGADGMITATPQSLNLSDVHTFADPAARNSEAAVEWHEGDIAIVTASGDVTSGGGTPVDTGFTYSAFVSATSFRVNGGWDGTNDVSLLPFGAGDDIRFQLFGSTTFAGSTTGGLDFEVVSVAQQGPTGGAAGNAIVTVNRDTLPASVQPPIDSGSSIFAAPAATTVTVGAGTYIYTGTDQTAAAATMNSDWTLLTVPDGTASDADLVQFINGSSTERLSSVTYNSASNELVFTNSASAAQTVSLAGSLTFAQTAAMTANPISTLAITAFTNAGLTAFPEDMMLFADGLKVTQGELGFNSGRTTITFTTPFNSAGQSIVFELAYLA